MKKLHWYYYLLIFGFILWLGGFLGLIFIESHILSSLIIIGAISIIIGVMGWVTSYKKVNISFLTYIFLGIIILFLTRYPFIPIYIKILFIVYFLFILLIILWKKFKKSF